MNLSLQGEKACPRVVVWLQVHGGDITSLAIESEERVARKWDLFQPVNHHMVDTLY